MSSCNQFNSFDREDGMTNKQRWRISHDAEILGINVEVEHLYIDRSLASAVIGMLSSDDSSANTAIIEWLEKKGVVSAAREISRCGAGAANRSTADHGKRSVEVVQYTVAESNGTMERQAHKERNRAMGLVG